MALTDTLTTLLRDGFILVFNQAKLDIVQTALAARQAGLGNMEVTCRIDKPLEKIARLRSEVPDMVVGAASLIDSPDMLATYNAAHADDPLPTVEQVVDAGAAYLVSAGNFRAETYERFAGEVALVPGCGSVTEIITQFAMGANLCKVFPAMQLGGPAFVKAIDPAIHKTISLVPTGGTSADNIGQYIAAGVLAVGCSFSAIPKAMLATVIDEQNYDMLARELAKLKRLVDSHRAQQYPSLDFTTAGLEQISQATGRNFNVN